MWPRRTAKCDVLANMCVRASDEGGANLLLKAEAPRPPRASADRNAGFCGQNTPFGRVFALQNSSNNSSPAPD